MSTVDAPLTIPEWAGAATWLADAVDNDYPPPARKGRGRAPRMLFVPWFSTQGVEIGATRLGEWFWRCPECRHWLGTYPNALEAKERGMFHVDHCEERKR